MRILTTIVSINDREAMLADCRAQGVRYIMCPAVDRGTAESAIAWLRNTIMCMQP